MQEERSLLGQESRRLPSHVSPLRHQRTGLNCLHRWALAWQRPRRGGWTRSVAMDPGQHMQHPFSCTEGVPQPWHNHHEGEDREGAPREGDWDSPPPQGDGARRLSPFEWGDTKGTRPPVPPRAGCTRLPWHFKGEARILEEKQLHPAVGTSCRFLVVQTGPTAPGRQ